MKEQHPKDAHTLSCSGYDVVYGTDSVFFCFTLRGLVNTTLAQTEFFGGEQHLALVKSVSNQRLKSRTMLAGIICFYSLLIPDEPPLQE